MAPSQCAWILLAALVIASQSPGALPEPICWSISISMSVVQVNDWMQLAGASLEKRKPYCLTYGGVTYDQWDYDRHEFINMNEG